MYFPLQFRTVWFYVAALSPSPLSGRHHSKDKKDAKIRQAINHGASLTFNPTKTVEGGMTNRINVHLQKSRLTIYIGRAIAFDRLLRCWSLRELINVIEIFIDFEIINYQQAVKKEKKSGLNVNRFKFHPAFIIFCCYHKPLSFYDKSMCVWIFCHYCCMTLISSIECIWMFFFRCVSLDVPEQAVVIWTSPCTLHIDDLLSVQNECVCVSSRQFVPWLFCCKFHKLLGLTHDISYD